MPTEPIVADSLGMKDVPEEESSMTPTSVNVQPRVWPAVAIGVVQLILYFGPSFVSENVFALLMGSFFGPVLGAVGLMVWWWFFSRLPRRERALGLLTFVGVKSSF